MAQTYNFSGDTLVIPGSYIKTTVLNGTSGLATAGVIALVGEADSGPAYDELKVSKVNGASILVDGSGNRVAFTPDELSLVQGMFGGGRLVEAFKALAAPFAAGGTNAIAGTPALVYVIKTNKDDAAKASVELKDAAGSPQLLCKFKAKLAGASGNSIKATVVCGSTLSKGTYPIEVSFQSGPSVDIKQTFNNRAAIKIVDTDGSRFAVQSDRILAGNTPTTYLFKNYATLNDLVAAITKDNAGQMTVTVDDEGLRYVSPVSLLDTGEYAASTGSTPMYVTVLGWQLKNASFSLVDVADVQYVRPTMTASAKLLDPVALAGGASGHTTNTNVSEALEVLKGVNLNFVIPLFSQDATADATAGETASGSNYTINSIVTDTVQHVLDMSAVKLKKNRQAFLSSNGTYAATKTLMNDSAVLLNTPYQYRASMAFQGVKALNLSGAVKDFQPWMLSVLTASAQAVAGYRPVFNKGLNILGFTNPDGYDGKIPAQEDALKSGLLVLADASNGIDTILLSDQTSYLLPDNNFVYNSIQAVYGADIISLTIQQQMQVFVGQSTGDVSAPIALSYLQSVMANLLNQRWIASSSDAPNGYKNAKVNIAAPVMAVSIEAKESTGIYFVPINLTISGVTSAA
jgi:hypothetical protein